MNLYEIRRQINEELAKPQPNEELITQLIIQRDKLSAQEVAPEPEGDFYSQMLQYTHG